MSNKAGRFDPDNYCPICGKRLHNGHCDQRVYSAIDGANNRFANEDNDEPRFAQARVIAEWERLNTAAEWEKDETS